MVPKDNPAHIANRADLGKPAVRLAMPNREYEGIAHQIKASLTHAGGNKSARSRFTGLIPNEHIKQAWARCQRCILNMGGTLLDLSIK
jgi:hypothetical protein